MIFLFNNTGFEKKNQKQRLCYIIVNTAVYMRENELNRPIPLRLNKTLKNGKKYATNTRIFS